MNQTQNWQMFNRLLDAGALRVQCGHWIDRVPPRGLRPWPRVEGMLLGLAIGDALGNTSEGLLPHERRARHGEVREYLLNHRAECRRVGLPSDDSQLAFWTLEQLLTDGESVPERLAARFGASRIFGAGGTVREFLANLREGVPWHEAGPESAGNGALMRIAPMLVPHLRRPSSALWTDTALAAMTTHNDTASTASCVAHVAMLWDLLAMTGAPRRGWWVDTFVSRAREIEPPAARYQTRGGRFVGWSGSLSAFVAERVPDAWRRGLSVVDACNEWYSGAYLLETVPSALHILMHHGDDPEEAIVRAVNDTVDNDTVGSIVGAAVGALHGVDALPPRWRAGLLGRTSEPTMGACSRSWR